jgi:hypothetical protein
MGHNATSFSAKYQPVKKRGPGKQTKFNNWLRIKLSPDDISNLDDRILKYIEMKGEQDPSVFDVVAANLILQALNPDPDVSFRAIQEVLNRYLGKPIQVHQMLDDVDTIEMEEVQEIDTSRYTREEILHMEELYEKGIESKKSEE